ncbi:arsenate reductase family protein [Acanthopleuribacter pedis]|uniref:Arsenate reductase n=1 Tax=Acanthopleuribacter pedis TaxID=442870 RepID=A0A8J7QDY8_9BACT|nr:ArsC/Spx/MgsR family protein [Acanthopleuribacter pedis]MBO1322069.1 hypothetical protein [Acanthopleuribacter pedis]
MSYVLLGIPNCSTVKKARVHLEEKSVPFSFRDLRKQPLGADEWRALVDQDDTGTLINTRSPSFRKTGQPAKGLDAETKVKVLLEQPTAMKRPALLRENTLLQVGYDADFYNSLPS